MPQRECGAHALSGTTCPICFNSVCQSVSPDGKLRCTRTEGHSGVHENGWVKPAVSWGTDIEHLVEKANAK